MEKNVFAPFRPSPPPGGGGDRSQMLIFQHFHQIIGSGGQTVEHTPFFYFFYLKINLRAKSRNFWKNFCRHRKVGPALEKKNFGAKK